MASVLITGAGKGIGFATALAVARAGHAVYATMREPGRAPALAQAAEKERLPIHISVMDVDSDASVRDAVAAIQKAHGAIDVLVNNAGIERHGSVEELALSEFRAVMETNYFGALRCIQAVMPQMRERRSGCIINVSSVAGRISSPPLTGYAASKWALEALSEGLAQEAKMFNVRVAIVEPGIIDTAMPRGFAVDVVASVYPQGKRMAAMFAASLERPVSPELVGQKILEIIDSSTWKLRHPVGPDAAGYMQFRASVTDEEWISQGAADDETWARNMAARRS